MASKPLPYSDQIESIVVHYNDGKRQVAVIGDDEVECEMLHQSGGLMNAGGMTKEEFIADLVSEIRKSGKESK